MPTFLQSKLTTVALIAGLVWMGAALLSVRQESRMIKKEQGDLSAKIASLERDNAALRDEINQSGDVEFMERLVKAKLNYRLADEQVAFVYFTPVSDAQASGSSAEQASGMSKYWRWLKGLFN